MKKNSIIKFVYLIMSVLIVILSLAGCSKQSVKTTPKNSAVKSNGIDLKGAEIRVLYHPITPAPGKEPFSEGGYENQKMYDRIKKIESDYNCTIKYVGDGTDHPAWQKLHTSIMVGDPTADIAYVGYEHAVQSVEKGGLYTVLNDYNDIMELDNADLWDQTAVQRMLTISGLTVGIQPLKRGMEQVNAGLVMYFNKSMLEREGVWNQYNLYELQKNRTWTWDKLDEVASKLVKDRDGDGKTDQYGMIFSHMTMCGLNASNSEGGIMAGLYGVSENDEPILLVRQQPQVNTMNFLCNSGAKHKGWFTSPNFGNAVSEGPRNAFANGEVGFIIEFGEAIQAFKKKEMKDTLGVVAVPIGPDNEVKDYWIGKRGCAPWVIPAGVPDTTASAQVMRQLCAPLYTAEEAEIGIEAALSDYIGEETEIIDTFKMLGEPERMCYSMDSPFIATWWAPFASYEGNFYALGADGMTGEALNKLWGDAAQKDMNKYWNMVLEGAEKMKAERAKKSLS